MLWQASDRFRVGLTYWSETELEFDSDLDISLPPGEGIEVRGIDADLEIPLAQNVRLGLTYDLGDKLTLLGTIAWEDWSTFDNVLIATPAGEASLPRNWEDTWKYAFGVRLDASGPWTWYTGVAYDTDPTSGGSRTADMPIDRQVRIAGGGFRDREGGHGRLGWTFTYADLGDATIKNGGNRPVSGAPWRLSGDYDSNRLIALSFNASFK